MVLFLQWCTNMSAGNFVSKKLNVLVYSGKLTCSDETIIIEMRGKKLIS